MNITSGKLHGPQKDFRDFFVTALFITRSPLARRGQHGERQTSVADTGSFELQLPDEVIAGSVVTFRAHFSNGAVAAVKALTLEAARKSLVIDVPAAHEPHVTAVPDPSTGWHVKLSGILGNSSGTAPLSGVRVIMKARPSAAATEQTVLMATTDGFGNFSDAYPFGKWAEVWAEVSAAPGVKLPITLQPDGSLPKRVLLAVATLEPVAADKPAGCDCDRGADVPRNPAPEELVTSAETFSADKGASCVEFNVPNRTIEEHYYTLIVRTTDPAIKGLRLPDESHKFVPVDVLDSLLGNLGVRPAQAKAVATSSRSTPARPTKPPASTPGKPATTAAPLLRQLRADVFRDLAHAPTPEAIEAAFRFSAMADAREQVEAARKNTAARAPLGPENPLDWDDEPTFYQATTIAHGHLVHFRQAWKADGFSLGDLLYSLPLAPAQKKQIAVIDWERRETGARSEELLATEQLAAELNRDRDILEIVNTTVEETLKGASAAITGGGGKSKGGSTSKPGASQVLGVAGGGAGAASGAIQNGNRALAASTLQQLNDRTVQSAAGVRSQRTTVVQSVAQGESVRVETETVANYNHCHAMTVEYFEVLRHFRVEHEVAGVDECLFVPLEMSIFSEPKALRWRTALQPRLLDPRLAPGFDALDRILHDYAGSDLPVGRYADEEIEGMEGDLVMEFAWVRPDDDEKGEFRKAAWDAVAPFIVFAGGPLGLFAAHLAGKAKAERDRVFREVIAPGIIDRFVQKMRVQVGSDRPGVPGFKDALMDATLISRPRVDAPLRVSLRPRGSPPPINRAHISAVTIDVPGFTAGKNEARALIRSGSLRYRTAHREDFLFRDRRIDNDLTETDAVRIDTPLNRQELRNPREEDKELARRLLAHLNENLEHSHRAIWFGMDAARRYMLLDGVTAPGTSGRSVASVVENRILAVVGNSLVLPVAPGFRLDPTHLRHESLLALYAPAAPLAPVRISLPTRGVFAEAVMGQCNSCEKIDDTRFWRWEESPIPGEAPAISPVSTDSRASSGPDLTAKDFAAPIINLQNAPSAPDPSGLANALSVLGASGLFRDVTGLEGNQKNAGAALSAALGSATTSSEAAAKAVERAADLQMQKQLSRDGDRILEKIDTAHASGAIDNGQRQQLTGDFLKGVSGGGSGKQPVSVQEFREIIAASGSSGVAASFDPATGVVDVKPVQLPQQTGPTGTGAVPTSQPVKPAPKAETMPADTYQGQLNARNNAEIRAFVPPVGGIHGSAALDLAADFVAGIDPKLAIDIAPVALAAGAKFGEVGKVGNLSLIQNDAPRSLKALFDALAPGPALVEVKLTAPTGSPSPTDARLVGAATVNGRNLLALSVPYYVVMREFRLFRVEDSEINKSLAFYSLTGADDRARFLESMKGWLNHQLLSFNVRILWQVEALPRDELPDHLADRPRPKSVGTVRFRMHNISSMLADGLTFIPPTDADDDSELYLASLLRGTDPLHSRRTDGLIVAYLTSLINTMTSGSAADQPTARRILIESLGRFWGSVAAHEIGHQLGLPDRSSTTVFGGYRDLMSGASELTWFGMEILDEGEGADGDLSRRVNDPMTARDFGEPMARFIPAETAKLEDALPLFPPSPETILANSVSRAAKARGP